MDLNNSKALAEVVKSFLRFVYFSVLGLVATFLVSLAADPSLASAHVTVAGQQFSVGFLLVAGVGGLAKLLDRYIHKNQNLDSNGLAPSFLQR